MCDDRGRGAPSNNCKACIENNVTCLYLDPDNGEWKAKVEFLGVSRAARVGRSRVRVKQERYDEDEDDFLWWGLMLGCSDDSMYISLGFSIQMSV